MESFDLAWKTREQCEKAAATIAEEINGILMGLRARHDKSEKVPEFFVEQHLNKAIAAAFYGAGLYISPGLQNAVHLATLSLLYKQFFGNL